MFLYHNETKTFKTVPNCDRKKNRNIYTRNFLSINKLNQNEMFIFLGPSINQANKTSFSNDPISKVKTNRKLINDKFS